jgi:biopolymer transport protein ExbB/TolQ
MTPLHRLDVIITNHLLAAALAFFRPKPVGLFHANHKGLFLLLKFRSDHFPTLAQTQQLMKRFFWCHAPMLANSNLSIHRKRRGTLKNNPVAAGSVKVLNNDPTLNHGNTDPLAHTATTRVSLSSFEAMKVVMEEAAAGEAMGLEKGMIVLSTAVAGGPFIGLLGTVWGVMETFSGIANAGGASITAMAPGVAGALICTVIGLLVAIPAMFSYNFMVTSIRAITQELDGFGARYANQIEHRYVDNRPLSEELRESNDALAARIVEALKRDGTGVQKVAKVQVRA